MPHHSSSETPSVSVEEPSMRAHSSASLTYTFPARAAYRQLSLPLPLSARITVVVDLSKGHRQRQQHLFLRIKGERRNRTAEVVLHICKGITGKHSIV